MQCCMPTTYNIYERDLTTMSHALKASPLIPQPAKKVMWMVVTIFQELIECNMKDMKNIFLCMCV